MTLDLLCEVAPGVQVAEAPGRCKHVREQSRSDYHADAYAYPVARLGGLNGRRLVVHCPEDGSGGAVEARCQVSASRDFMAQARTTPPRGERSASDDVDRIPAASVATMAPMARVLFILTSLLLAASASASDGDMIIPASQVLARPVTAKGNSKVVAYGPVSVSKQVQTTKGVIYLYVEGATFGGRAGAVQFYLAFPPRGASAQQALRIAEGDYVGSFGGMEGSPAGAVTRVEEVNNFESKGMPFRPRDHLQRATEVVFALVDPPAYFKFERIVISTEPPGARAPQGDASATPPCSRKLIYKWELGKVAENCMDQKPCVLDERLKELACAGSKDPEACMSRCLSSGLSMIAKAYQTEPPESAACVACLSRDYARYLAKCGAACPACPATSPQATRCKECAQRERISAACIQQER